MEEKDFNFPFTPYPIQKELMAAIYRCIDEGKVGIFESPTGLSSRALLSHEAEFGLRDGEIAKHHM
jgi:chromosome transmission fidelity protein 1